jgi:cell division septal protein FtsQ
MFFKRKAKNRRHSRDYILDVRLSAAQRRESRLRRLTLFLATSSILLGTVFVAWRGGDAAIQRFVFENRAFAIRSIEVETDGVLSAEQIRSWAGVRPKDNLLALDLARVERDLKLVPAIESAVIERVLPYSLKIRVIEREPVAQVIFPRLRQGGAYEGGVYTLDANGYFMFPVEPSQRTTPAVQTNDPLPLMVGLPTRDIRPGKQVESPQVRAALELIRAFGHSTMDGVVDLKQVDVSVPGVVVATTAQGNTVTFGLADFDAQLRRWRLVHDHAQRFGKHVEALDLGVANNAPMLWVDATGVTPVPAKPVKPSRYKKKHV